MTTLHGHAHTHARWLAPTENIDSASPALVALAEKLCTDAATDEQRVRACFEWVRDRIDHSSDARRGRGTCMASDVLSEGIGYCYAKANLLAALVRSQGVPAALCYQRLVLDEDPADMCLHGLVAVWLDAHGWVRVDPRGNKPGVDAQFHPPEEQLAFTRDVGGECDLPGLYVDVRTDVAAALPADRGWDEILANLPDTQTAARSCAIRWATEGELERLQAIEMDAGERFREAGLPEVADAPPLPLGALRRARAEARLFVASRDRRLVGFAMLSIADGDAHLDELSVRRDSGRNGAGSELLEYACDWARSRGLGAMTLSTFRDVAFNAPFYARRGFEALAGHHGGDEGPELRLKRAQERARGLHDAQRLCMRRTL